MPPAAAKEQGDSSATPLERLLARTPTCRLQPYRFFVSWQGVLTLAYTCASAFTPGNCRVSNPPTLTSVQSLSKTSGVQQTQGSPLGSTTSCNMQAFHHGGVFM